MTIFYCEIEPPPLPPSHSLRSIARSFRCVLSAACLFRLEELGGSHSLCGLARLIMCLAEVPFFYLSGPLIRKLGVRGVIALAQIAYLTRFVYYSVRFVFCYFFRLSTFLGELCLRVIGRTLPIAYSVFVDLLSLFGASVGVYQFYPASCVKLCRSLPKSLLI